MQSFLFLNLTFLNLRFKRSIIKIFSGITPFNPKIIFKTSLACNAPTIFEVGPKMPSASQFNISFDGIVW